MTQEVMRRDVFPAEVAMPGGHVFTGVRAVVTSHRLLVYAVDSKSKSIVVAADRPLAVQDSVPGDRSTLRMGALEVGLEDGKAWVNKARGCGCGSPLKVFRSPFSWTRQAA